MRDFKRIRSARPAPVESIEVVDMKASKSFKKRCAGMMAMSAVMAAVAVAAALIQKRKED